MWERSDRQIFWILPGKGNKRSLVNKRTFDNISIAKLQRFQYGDWNSQHTKTHHFFPGFSCSCLLCPGVAFTCYPLCDQYATLFLFHFLSGQFAGPAQLKDKSILVCSVGIIMKSAVKLLSCSCPSAGNLMATCQLFHPVRHRQRASDGRLYSNQSAQRQMLKSPQKKV